MVENQNNHGKVQPVNTSLVMRGRNAAGPVSLETDNSLDDARQRLLLRLQEWRRLIYRHKLLILSILLLAVPLIAIEAYRGKSIYQATALLEVRPEPAPLIDRGEMFYYNDPNNTKSEIIIIKSQPVLERAILKSEIHKDAAFFTANRKRSAWEALQIISGRGKTDNLANTGPKTDKQPFAAAPNAPDKATTTGGFPEPEAVRLAPYLAALGAGLKAESIQGTRLVRILFTHADPATAARVANSAARAFIEYNFDSRTSRYNATSEWLEETTRKLKAQVEQAEQKLATYSREHNIFSLEGKENLTAEKLAKLHGQVMTVETDRLLKQSLYEEVKQGRVAQLPEAFADSKTAELKKMHNELALEAAQLGVRFGPKHPKLVEVRQQMAVIQEQIDSNRLLLEERLKADYERAVREENSLKAALDKAKAEAVQQNQASIQYNVLQQDLATAKTLYTDFLNKTSQADIQRAEQYNNVRLIEAAKQPDAPVGPRRQRTIFFGFVFSLALGLGLAWLLEHLNTTVRSVEDISRVTQLPTLAVIPKLTGEAARLHSKAGELTEASQALSPGELGFAELGENNGFSAAAEAYRMLRTAVLLSTAGQPPRRILVTSGQPGDGKTTTTFNIAVTLTQLDAKVVIVDCDLRKPRLHKVVELERGQGLSNYLASGGSLAKLLQTTRIPHLSMMSSGPLPPNPSELLSSAKMKELLSLLEDQFDYILLDSPPVVSVTDSMILSTLVDGVIVITKSGQSRSEVLRRSILDLSSVGARLLGVVLNDYNPRHDRHDNYYQYRYSYDYRERQERNGNST